MRIAAPVLSLVMAITCAAQIGFIDAPSKMQVLTGYIGASGWALDFSTTISSVQFSVDGTNVGYASLGGYRPDVCSVIGNYPGCPYQGWSISFDTTQFSDGPHNLSGLIIAADGRQARLNQAFIVDNGHAGLSNSTLYRIINRQTGKSLDIASIDPVPGAALQQYTYWGGPNQLVRFFATSDGFFELEMVHSLKALGALNGSGNGAVISQALYADIPEQKWQLANVGGGYYLLVNQASGNVLDVTGGSAQDGTPIQLWTNLWGLNQQWQIIAEPNMPGGTFGMDGTTGSSTYPNLDPDDVVAPGETALTANIAPAQVPCENDAQLYDHATAGRFAGYDGLVHLNYGYTDAAGKLELVAFPDVKTAFDTGFSNWNSWSGTTGYIFAPVSPGSSPLNMDVKIAWGNNFNAAGCSAVHTKYGVIYYNTPFAYGAKYDPPSAAAIATHEIGHTMGLGDTGTSGSWPPTVMNQSHRCLNPDMAQKVPTNDDATAARACSNRAQGLKQTPHSTYQLPGAFSQVLINSCFYYLDTIDWFFDGYLSGNSPSLYSLNCW